MLNKKKPHGKKYTKNEDMCWTIVGSEYERLGSNGTLQGVYSLPVTSQQDVGTAVPLFQELPGSGNNIGSDNEEEETGYEQDDGWGDISGWT